MQNKSMKTESGVFQEGVGIWIWGSWMKLEWEKTKRSWSLFLLIIIWVSHSPLEEEQETRLNTQKDVVTVT